MMATSRVAPPRGPRVQAAREAMARLRVSSGEAVAREQREIRRGDGRPHVRVKAGRGFPHAARGREDPFQERNAALDSRAEAAEFVIDPWAPHMSRTASPRFFAKQTSATPSALHEHVGMRAALRGQQRSRSACRSFRR